MAHKSHARERDLALSYTDEAAENTETHNFLYR